VIRYERGPDGWTAHADVRVGVAHVPVRVDLGDLDREPDAGGLRGTPVVIVASASLPVAHAGALRAGRSPAVLVLPAAAPTLGGQMLLAVAQGVEIVFVEGGGAAALATARALGGTAIAPGGPGAEAVLRGLGVDVTVVVPNDRAAERASLTAAGRPGVVHHVVDADPTPAFDELGWRVDPASPDDVASAAAGVVAGRLAVGNRRWRSGIP
jgi:hypothetical protein